MFGMGMPEIIVILAIALIVLGPKKLPEIAKALGRGISEFKKATQDFKESLDVDNDLKEARDTLQEIKGDIDQTVRASTTKSAAPASQQRVSKTGAVAEEALEHSFDGDIKGAPKGPVEDTAGHEAQHKEPSEDV
jgi:TatA/E family protein of Tat protein translocase